MKIKSPISTLIAALVGLVVLMGYFFSDLEPLPAIRSSFLQWAITLAAVALVIGVLNLLFVHIRKAREDDENAVFSLLLGASLVITFIIVLVWGPNHAVSRGIFQYIQVPVEASLMALLAVSLAFAAARLLRRRQDTFSTVFFLTAIIILLGTGTFILGENPLLSERLRDIRAWIAQVPAAAGARGILLGIALGTIATGIRILMGADRPYGE